MGRRWTDEQLAVALNPSLTCTQAALQLHRTIGAVHAARMKYPKGARPRTRPLPALEYCRYRGAHRPGADDQGYGRKTWPLDELYEETRQHWALSEQQGIIYDGWGTSLAQPTST
ncbi:hypothetical protein [Mycobacteroides abscessus]|uniref:hypothetical protein n=1 Tax=Mycobacteroides abscessus TaxID=36809 RepID=UPI0013F61D99|nr:hypothetical protein [Mycobacteroides abscessus]